MKRTPLKRTSKLGRSGQIKPKRRTRTKEYRDGRVVLSEAAWYRLKEKLWAERERVCGICGRTIFFREDVELDHIIPRGMGGGTRDDRTENLQLSHRWCNREKGSRRI
jgi:5-methylcytosine-specific restriction endonuclease McrA